MTITYRNRKTGQVVETDGPQPVFDRGSQWDRVEADDAKQVSEPEGYAAQSPEDLAELVTKRGLEATGTGKGGNVLKKDLVAELEADDAKAASEPDGYWAQSPDDLEALVTDRDLEVTGTSRDGKVLKKDLIAALEANDEQ